MQGRRVDGLRDLEQPGDYTFANREDQKAALWFILPNGNQGRIAMTGMGEGGEPEWEVEEHADGTITVKPSIDEGSGGWHGHLTEGVWS